jgi:ABC-2 type transport system ATP-binding protein
MKKIYSVKDLYKKFGNNVLLNSISFSVRQGEVIGLVGHNGVGKTTLMKCILELSKTDGGGFISDSNNRVNYENIGALIEYPGLYPFLTGMENIKIFLKEVDKEKLFWMAKKLEFYDKLNIKVKNYSLGMKQKLGIIVALLQGKRFVVLDEPINGLDPKSIKAFREIIGQLSQEGVAFLISSHVLSELENIVTRVLILDGGEIVQDILMSDKNKISLSTIDNEKAAKLISSYVTDLTIGDSNVAFTYEKKDLNKIIKKLLINEVTIIDISTSNSLEDILLGHSYKEGSE